MPLAGGDGWPTRLVVFFWANGAPEKNWLPATPVPLAELSPILSPLAAHSDDLFVISRLGHRATFKAKDGHMPRDAVFLTGTAIGNNGDPTGSNINVNGVSMDQLAAQHLGGSTRLRSLELSLDPVYNGIAADSGISCIYGGHISWPSATTSSRREIEPHAVFDRLFRVRPPAKRNSAGPETLVDQDDLGERRELHLPQRHHRQPPRAVAPRRQGRQAQAV